MEIILFQSDAAQNFTCSNLLYTFGIMHLFLLITWYAPVFQIFPSNLFSYPAVVMHLSLKTLASAFKVLLFPCWLTGIDLQYFSTFICQRIMVFLTLNLFLFFPENSSMILYTVASSFLLAASKTFTVYICSFALPDTFCLLPSSTCFWRFSSNSDAKPFPLYLAVLSSISGIISCFIISSFLSFWTQQSSCLSSDVFFMLFQNPSRL